MGEKVNIINYNRRDLKGAGSLLDSSKYLALILILPAFLIVFSVFLYPILYSLFMSLNKINFAARTFEYLGAENYIMLFKDKYFLQSISITIYFTIITVLAEIVLGIGMAMVLSRDFKGRGFVRGIMILPWALPTVVNAIMWKWIFNSNYGALNALLSQLNFIEEYKIWLGSSLSALNCMIFANVWKETPYVVLLTIAALSNIPTELYESARVDGANTWRTFWRITLPIIKPVVMILVITKTIWAIQTFDLAYILTGGGPASATELVAFFIHKNTFKFLKFGYGSAMAYMLTLVTFMMSFAYIKILSKNNEII